MMCGECDGVMCGKDDGVMCGKDNGVMCDVGGCRGVMWCGCA